MNIAFTPPAPVPLAKPLSRLRGAAQLLTDPLGMWTQRHFDEWVLSGKSLLGHITIVSDPASIRTFMLDHAANYVKDDLQLRVLKPSLGEGLFTVEGPAWKVQRRALAGLFTPRTVAGFAGPMAAAAVALTDRWARRGGRRLLQVDREMTQVTLDGLDASIFSGGLGGDRAQVHDAQSFVTAAGAIDPLDLFGAPAWIPRVSRLRAAPVRRYFDGLIDRLVSDRRALIAADPAAAPRDLLTLLFEARDPETGEGLTPAVVRDNVLTFLGAGTETTSSALSWALYLLSQDHAARERIEAEVDDVLGGRTVGADDVAKLVFTRAVIDETLRLYPTAPLIQRMAVAEDTLHGVTIPPGSTVVYAPWVLHRHRKLWDRPGEFDPTRFLAGAPPIDRFAYLPFGAGPRVCIGASFALQEAVVTLATIVQRCRLDLLPGAVVMPEHRITLRPKGGLPMLVTAR
ncbi:cytochrome P450 [Polymorphobacter sp. PAMC 29334]|uniref:cytochrome P450 n=1 Tax=Polymorphobacter sp. PAMC 29334 TaxID=2862331 RepID=UPI001C684319|nr:cytochrome P450 [Polymorphobacter sp. PAMC 29334]QYE35263.1 cytochrome P450 [Polymorphobacter sp. PAMC 29334]